MRVVRFALFSALFLTGCQERAPDFSLASRPYNNAHVLILRGYQPRGTIEGYISLSFDNDQQRIATLRRIEAGKIGWLNEHTVAIIANNIEYSNLDSDYFPDGTVDSRIHVIVCNEKLEDCSFMLKKLLSAASPIVIKQFPEG